MSVIKGMTLQGSKGSSSYSFPIGNGTLKEEEKKEIPAPNGREIIVWEGNMKVITVPCAFDNYAYILICEKSGKAAVVDPTEAYPVLMQVEKAGAELTAILCTHHHADHVGDIESLLNENPGLDVYCYHSDRQRIFGINRPLSGGDRFSVGDLAVEVLHTPGHTKGSITYFVGGALFTGDTLFGGGCGRLFEGTAEEMYDSLKNTIKVLPDETKIYFGHEYTLQNLTFAHAVEPENNDIVRRLAAVRDLSGDKRITTPSTLALEIETNPFLRCNDIDIEECNSPLEVFTRLREMKDGS